MTLLIRIQQHDFTLTQRYEPGHVCSPGEAAALNQVFAENIRNNVAKWVIRELGPDKILPTDVHERLQSKISRYADSYQFRAISRTRQLSALEAAVEEITQGRDYLKEDPSVLERARELLLQRQAITNQSLKGIFDDPDE